MVIANRRVKGKRCRDCKRFLYPTARWFHRDRNRIDSFQLYCKDCKRTRDRRSYERNREKRLQTARAWKIAHPDELSTWRHVYNADYRRGRRWRTIHIPETADRSFALKLCASCGKAFDQSEFRRGRRECRGCWNARQPKYRNSAKRAVYHQNRRARQVGRVSPEEWQAVLDRYGHRCAYCGTGGKLTMDHVEPLSEGGPHQASNLVPACRTCNSRKHTKRWKPMPPPLADGVRDNDVDQSDLLPNE